MFRIAIGLVAMSTVLVTLTACGQGGPKTVAVTERDAGSKVELRQGDTLEVTLVGNPSTGFMWEPQSLDTAVITRKGEWTFKADNTAPGFVGSPGKLTLLFEAVTSGQATLRLIYHQPFDPVTPPAKTFEMTVVVR